MRKRAILLGSAALLAALSLPAQTILPGPGKYLAVASVKIYSGTTFTNYKGEIYLIDPVTLKAQALTVPTFLDKVGLNSITGVSPVTGFVTTIDGRSTASPKSAGDLYRYVIAGTKVTLMKLNTQPFTGGNLAQVAQIGTTLYVCTQDSTNKNGYLWSVPVAGGAPKLLVDFGKLIGWSSGLANGLTAFKGKVYVVSGWTPSSSKPHQLWEYDPATKKPAFVMDLPKGMYSPSLGLYPIHMGVDTTRNLLIVAGVYGDVAFIDPSAKKVVEQYHCGKWRPSTKRPWYYLLNSCVYNPDTRDVGLGSRYGSFALQTGAHAAQDLVPGVGSSATTSRNSVTGITYFPAGGHCYTYGDGGLGSPATATYRFWPINVNLGLPVVGQKFGFHLHGATGGAAAILFLGVSKTKWGLLPLPFDLGPLGAPGNFIRCSGDSLMTFVTSGSGAGNGQAGFLASSVPASGKGYYLYSQWLILDKGANSLGVVVTNARDALIQ